MRLKDFETMWKASSPEDRVNPKFAAKTTAALLDRYGCCHRYRCFTFSNYVKRHANDSFPFRNERDFVLFGIAERLQAPLQYRAVFDGSDLVFTDTRSSRMPQYKPGASSSTLDNEAILALETECVAAGIMSPMYTAPDPWKQDLAYYVEHTVATPVREPVWYRIYAGGPWYLCDGHSVYLPPGWFMDEEDTQFTGVKAYRSNIKLRRVVLAIPKKRSWKLLKSIHELFADIPPSDYDFLNILTPNSPSRFLGEVPLERDEEPYVWRSKSAADSAGMVTIQWYRKQTNTRTV